MLPLWRIHRTVGMGGDKLVAEVAGDDVEERIGDPLRDAWREEYVAIKAEVDPLPGAAELVARAGARRVTRWRSRPRETRSSPTRRSTTSTSATRSPCSPPREDAEESKPEPDLIGVTLDRLDGIRRAVMVGDTPYDVEAAERAGLGCIGLRSGGYSEAELVDAGALLVVDAPEDLIGIEWETYLRARLTPRRGMTRFGYTLMTEQAGPRELVQHAVRAEAAGFDFEVMSDHYFPWLSAQGHAPYAWSVLGAVAHATERVGLMTYVTCPTIRYHPAVVAQKAATLQLLAEGRFTLGLGSGENLNEHVVGQGWPAINDRQAMLREAISVIRQLHTGELVDHRGEYFQVDSARIWDLPDNPPEIAVATAGERAVNELAAARRPPHRHRARR